MQVNELIERLNTIKKHYGIDNPKVIMECDDDVEINFVCVVETPNQIGYLIVLTDNYESVYEIWGEKNTSVYYI